MLIRGIFFFSHNVFKFRISRLQKELISYEGGFRQPLKKGLLSIMKEGIKEISAKKAL